MAGGWSLGRGLAAPQGIAVNTSTSRGTLLASASGPLVKGPWTELIATTQADTTFVIASCDNVPSYGNCSIFDIGVGAAGGEAAVVSDIVVNMWGLGGIQFCFPLAIAKGTRIVARMQSTWSGADSGAISLVCFGGGFNDDPCGSAIDTLGFVQGTGYGTPIDPGATPNTKGAFAEISAGTPHVYKGFFAAFDNQGYTGTPSASTYYPTVLDIAIGAAGGECVIVPDLYLIQSLQNPSATMPIALPYIGMPIRAGTRLSARLQSGNSDASNRTIGVTIYGVR